MENDEGSLWKRLHSSEELNRDDDDCTYDATDVCHIANKDDDDDLPTVGF